MRIKIVYDDISYRLKQSTQVKQTIIKVIRKEKKIPDDLIFIITSDEELLKINKEFLKKDTLTDVIAFGYNYKKNVRGEIYISLEAVKRNAHNYKVSLRNEIIRVMIHGTLHLCGYEDRSMREKKIMKEREDHWLNNERY